MSYIEELRETAKAFGVDTGTEHMDVIQLYREIAKTLGIDLGTEHKGVVELLALINKALPNALGGGVSDKEGYVLIGGTTVYESMFEDSSSLVGVSIPNVSKVEARAFYGCSTLADINIDNVETFGEFALYNTLIENVNLIKATDIPAGLFDSCKNLKNVNAALVESIGNESFESCSSLINVYAPKVKTIGTGAFRNSSIKSITLPVLESMDAYAFANCGSLTDIYLGLDGLVVLNDTSGKTIVNTNGVVNIHVKAEYLEQFTADAKWNTLITNGYVTIVGDYTD